MTNRIDNEVIKAKEVYADYLKGNKDGKIDANEKEAIELFQEQVVDAYGKGEINAETFTQAMGLYKSQPSETSATAKASTPATSTSTTATTQVNSNSTTTSCFENSIKPEENDAKSEQIKNLKEKIARKEKELETKLENIAKKDISYSKKFWMLQNESKLFKIASQAGAYTMTLGFATFAFGALISGSATAIGVGMIALVAGVAVYGTCALTTALKDDEDIKKDYYGKSLEPLVQEINNLKQELANLTDKQKINTTI